MRKHVRLPDGLPKPPDDTACGQEMRLSWLKYNEGSCPRCMAEALYYYIHCLDNIACRMVESPAQRDIAWLSFYLSLICTDLLTFSGDEGVAH